MNYTIYDIATGIILLNYSGHDIESYLGPGQAFIEEFIDGDDYYILDNIPIKKPKKPDAWHVFDNVTKTWQPIDNYLEIIKNKYKIEVNENASKRILAKYPYYRQLNNPDDTVMKDWINNIRAISNITNGSISAATTLDEITEHLFNFIENIDTL